MRASQKVAIWISTGAACLACGGMLLAPAAGQEPDEDAREDVQVITEAEDVPNEVGDAPRETQTLPLERPEASGRAFLGVDLDRQYPDAAIVTRVYRGTPAAAAGLRPGDRIWAIDNHRVESIDELITLIARMRPGQRVEVSFSRPRTVQVPLGRRGPPVAQRSPGSGATGASTPPTTAPRGTGRNTHGEPRGAKTPRDERVSAGKTQSTATPSDASP